MPPLSAYTDLESLLFFQSLASYSSRPANFASISNLLRSNDFIQKHAAFDAQRLTPEALEDLYATLMRDGWDSVAPHEPNGRPVDSSKKRKISSPRPEATSHVSFFPGLVSHLYARYKELVTREIKSEEEEYNKISDEIERLQKEERDALPETRPTPASAQQQQQPTAAQPKPEPPRASVMETNVDEKERRPVDAKPKGSAQPLARPPSSVDVKPESQPQVPEKLKPPAPVSPAQGQQQPTAPLPQKPQKGPHQPIQPHPQASPPTQPPILPPQSQLLPPPSQPPSQSKPSPQVPVPSQQQQAGPQPPATIPPQHPGLPNGQASAPQLPLAPRAPPLNAPPGKAQPAKVQDPPLGPPKPTAVPAQSPKGTPLGPPVTTPVPGPVQPPPMDKSTGKQPAKGGAPMPTPPAQRAPPQPSFQQWSLNSPQTPLPPPSTAKPPPSKTAGKPGPLQPPLHTPKHEPKKSSQALPPPAVPVTPGPASTAAPSPAASAAVDTPVAAAQALFSESRGSRPPRPSIDTSGSLTPWKKTPRLSIPESPRSPDRPRPEDVSPISEKAPSLMGSREATPEAPQPEPTRRKRKGRGRPAKDASPVDSKPSTGTKRKGDKPTLPAAKRRDRSTASSRSRGRSVFSRDDESAAESAFQGKIKHEMPTTPAGVPETAEPEPRPSGRKGAGAPASEDRPGRGRPKRKRPPSEAPDPEPEASAPAPEPQSEPSPLSRFDPTQSAPYVLCARNFPRTGAPIMNDVTMHKHASIFTKPLTERDAPGYRDLIYRPQDLKSIKSCIHAGSRAVAAATEAANTPVDGESPAPNANSNNSSGTPSKNAVLMLQRAEDVIPPRAIVNSAQLEKELIRMFANAVMFNPIPKRGFGPAFPMTRDAGSSGSGSGSGSVSRESTLALESDEGGIIKDTVEMFGDVEQAVTRWRAAERTADELASRSVSVLAVQQRGNGLNADGDENKGENK